MGRFARMKAEQTTPRQTWLSGTSRAIRNAGLNSVRVYTVPPRWLLDLAAARGLRLMIGLPLGAAHCLPRRQSSSARHHRSSAGVYVRQCAGHPAVLCYAIGNEIPASVVRWYGKRRIQNFLAKLCEVVRREDPGALLTYVNYPTTEYLETPFVDFVAFNVYLELTGALSGLFGTSSEPRRRTTTTSGRSWS